MLMYESSPGNICVYNLGRCPLSILNILDNLGCCKGKACLVSAKVDECPLASCIQECAVVCGCILMGGFKSCLPLSAFDSYYCFIGSHD